MPCEEEQFQSLIDDLAATCHGCAEFAAIRAFLGTSLTKTAQREAFLLPRLMQEAILWDGIKDSVWKESTKQEANRFAFLQGDVIGTTMVLALGMAETSQQHELWLVLAPDCDCVRASHVRVAPVFPVFSGTIADRDRTQRFNNSLSLRTSKAFPLPRLPGDDDPALRGYFADLEIPYYLREDDKGLATPYASMTVVGWHLLNGLIQDKETRAADIAEAVAIRTAQAR
jgi:hypothetical protein